MGRVEISERGGSTAGVNPRLPGGYVDDDGTVHREVEFHPLTGVTEEWLAGLSGPAATVITQLLARTVRRIGALVQPGATVVRRLLVGDREFLVIKLRQMTAGDRVILHRSCTNPDCARPMDLPLSLAELAVEERPVTDRVFRLSIVSGGEVTFSLPTGADQEALSDCAGDSNVIHRLLARCIQRLGMVERPDPAAIAALPVDVIEQIEGRMRELSPDLTAELEGACPECAVPFSHPLDLSGLLLGDLVANGRSLGQEVHLLAWHYHWSEREILSMTREKRRGYLDLLDEHLAQAQGA